MIDMPEHLESRGKLKPPERLSSREAPASAPTFDLEKVREDFPVLGQTVNGKPLVYLDNAATTQKPRQVIDALTRYYSEYNSNIHRGVHTLSQQATKAYEDARSKVQRFIGAPRPEEVIFVRGATEGINLVAQSFARRRLSRGDEIVVTAMEHHSNIVPWQMLCEETGAVLRVVPFDERGELLIDEYARLVGPRTRLVAIVHVSNALGTVNPVRRMVRLAHDRDIPVLIDGAQAAPHLPIDVEDLGCDFYAFSGHKLFGPTGIGALWVRGDILDEMPPYQGGGEMILSVSFEGTTYANAPHRFEAGTPHIAGAIGLGAAIDYLSELGFERIEAHEKEILRDATETVGAIEGVRLVGTAPEKAGVLSFVLDHVHPHDVGTILDQEGIAVRAGHHCAQPVMERLGVPATVRASFAFYNTHEEIDRLAAALVEAREIFR